MAKYNGSSIWLDIDCFEGIRKGLYQVSQIGEVKCLPKLVNGKWWKEKIMLTEIVKGYRRVMLQDRKVKKRISVHKDGNTLNNNVSNLEWCTISENTKHSYNTGLQVMSKGSKNPCSKSIGQFYNGKLIKIWGSLSELNNIGLRKPNISACALGKIKSAYGYQWSYNI